MLIMKSIKSEHKQDNMKHLKIENDHVIRRLNREVNYFRDLTSSLRKELEVAQNRSCSFATANQVVDNRYAHCMRRFEELFVEAENCVVIAIVELII